MNEAKERMFGTNHLGFVLWLSEDGSRAVVLRFDTDTDKNGKIEGKVGEHGELLGDSPTTVLVDTRTNKETVYDAFVATDVRRSGALFEKAGDVVWVNGRSGEVRTLAGADTRPDTKNPCLPPRSASVSPDGSRLAWITSAGQSESDQNAVAMLDLNTGKTFQHGFLSPIYRVEQTNTVPIVHIATDTDNDGEASWPVSSGTCPCWWCKRFARSVGRYVQSGDRPTPFFINDDGSKANIEIYGRPIGFAPRENLALDDDCRTVGKHGSRYALLECDRKNVVVDSRLETVAEVSRFAKVVDYSYVPTGTRYPVMTKGQMGALRLESPDRVDPGPRTDLLGERVHPSGWWLGRDTDHVIAWNVEDRRERRVDLPGVSWLSGLVVRARTGERPQSLYLLNPETGKTAVIDDDPALVARNGCAVRERVTKRISRGPYELICP